MSMTQLQEAILESHKIISHLASNPLILVQHHKALSKFSQLEVRIVKMTNPICDPMWNIDVLYCT